MDSYFVRFADLPLTVKGMTIKDEYDDYSIYINARLNVYAQMLAMKHELQHITKGHFSREMSVSDLEKDITIED